MVTNEFMDIENSGMVSEPIAAYERIEESHCLRQMETFEQQWQRALTVDEFRERCKQQLRAVYG